MTKKPYLDYSQFGLSGFKKTFPNLAQYNPYEVASWLYFTVSAFSGRDGKCWCGGGEDDIHNLIFAAAVDRSEFEIGRKIKNKLRNRLRRAWIENDHATIYNVARGFERGASMKVVDYRLVFWAFEGV